MAAALRMSRERFMQRFADALRTRPPAFLNKGKAGEVQQMREAAAAAAGGIPASTGRSSKGPASLVRRLTAQDPAAAGVRGGAGVPPE